LFQNKNLTFVTKYDIINIESKKGEKNMAIARKIEREILRNEYLQKVIDAFLELDETVLRVKSNEIAIPVVGCEGNEDFIVITVKVPTGANKGLEPYDGYEMAQDYEMKRSEKAEKAKLAAEAKAKKIAKDKANREKLAKSKANYHQ
jgi:hypothetical protein